MPTGEEEILDRIPRRIYRSKSNREDDRCFLLCSTAAAAEVAFPSPPPPSLLPVSLLPYVVNTYGWADVKIRELPTISDRNKTRGELTGRTPSVARKGRCQRDDRAMPPAPYRRRTIAVTVRESGTLRRVREDRILVSFRCI